MAADTYLSKTVDSNNVLKRFAHRTRHKLAVSSIPDGARSVLDFGAGDGYFLNQLAMERPSVASAGFEPYMAAVNGNIIPIFNAWDDVVADAKSRAGFDAVTCFETLEHFSEPRQRDALARMASILRPNGTLVISVPIEVGMPAVVKNLFRYFRYKRNHPEIYTLKNIRLSLAGRPIPNLRIGDEYLSHMGFDYRDLARMISERFVIHSRTLSPFPAIGSQFNSQVFYLAKPRPTA